MILGSILFLVSQVAPQPVPQSLALTHVTVIDVIRGRAMADMTVVVDRGRIRAVGESKTLLPPANATIADAK